MRKGWWLVVTLAMVVFAFGLVAGCGDDDDEPSDMSSEDIVARVEEAVVQPGMVFHAEGDDGSEVWLDPENQRYRRREPTLSGGLTSIGSGWTRFRFDPFANEVVEDDLTPAATSPRIDDPAVAWFEPLTALGYGTELEVIGLTQADGMEVVAVNARSPVINEEDVTTSYLEGRVEVNADTYLPTAFERREVLPNGATVTPAVEEEARAPNRIRYTSQLVPVSDVPEGFFDKSVVEDEVRTLAESVEELKGLGLTPYWVGDQVQGPGGILVLPEVDPLVVDSAKPSGEFHYSLVVPTSESSAEPLLDTVIIRMATGLDQFTPPVIEAFAGDVPEQRQEVTVRGGPGVLLTSILTPSDLPCPTGDCPLATVPLFRRLAFMIGDTAFQIETMARVSASGQDLNGYNTVEGITGLAEALVEANPPAEEPPE